MNAIAKLSDGICCLNDYILKSEEENFNETHQDISDYYSYFNGGTGQINSDVLERSLFTSRECGGEQIELSRNNKLFGLPVSLKSYVQKSNRGVRQRVFERLKLAQSDHHLPSVEAGCRLTGEPINYYKTSGVGGNFIISKSQLTPRRPSVPPSIGPNHPPDLDAPLAASKPTASAGTQTADKDKEDAEKSPGPVKRHLELPSANTPQTRSNPVISRTDETLIKKAPSMPTIKQFKPASRCPSPLASDCGENQVALTKYGAYLLGL